MHKYHMYKTTTNPNSKWIYCKDRATNTLWFYSTFEYGRSKHTCISLDVVGQHVVYELATSDHNSALTVFYTVTVTSILYTSPPEFPFAEPTPTSLTLLSHSPCSMDSTLTAGTGKKRSQFASPHVW